jgi:hypothetical protein
MDRTSLATQQAIVAEIEAEQALVAANSELIARFEKKISHACPRLGGGDIRICKQITLTKRPYNRSP